MKKDKGTQFLCKDCEKYSLCEYYHCRKEDSYICKYFHLPNKLDKIRAEIEQMIAESEKAIKPFDGMEVVIYTKGFKDGIGSAIDVIDKYKAERVVEE